MHPTLTYELKVAFPGDPGNALRVKEKLIDWLLVNGVESFVEGQLDVDFNLNQDEPPRDFYSEMGGDLAPVSVYRYSRESLEDLQAKMDRDFSGKVDVELTSMETQEWMEGWKESFKPFATRMFYVRPPWEASHQNGLMDLVIEPGMAFGTGQHATTRLCLELLEEISGRGTVLDVGTGTGILAIAAKKLGYGACFGTDIEDDAIIAAVENARMNGVDVSFWKGSLPKERVTHDLVFANILAVVLIRLMDDLAAVTKVGGKLILSGILVEEEQEVVLRAEKAGLELVRAARQDGWSGLLLSKG